MREKRVIQLFLSLLATAANAWHITPPTVNQDWRQLAVLVTQSFNVNTPCTNKKRLARFSWDLIEKRIAEQATYRRFVKTAKRLRGTKYSLFVAKEEGQVIGVAEMGIRDMETKRVTIGVLCVDKDHRQKGVGSGLIQHCERLAAELWNENDIHAEVEEQNIKALALFNSRGFVQADQRVIVGVQRGRKLEQIPHVLLSKQLPESVKVD
jgi:GNAT superfamily N-acetyltransferase